ncbi:MAG: PEP-CTERM sorting domain-containing protein [Phycisphaerae bacterium]
MKKSQMKIRIASLVAAGMVAPAVMAAPTYPSLSSRYSEGFYLFQGQSSSSDAVTAGVNSASESGPMTFSSSAYGSMSVSSAQVNLDEVAGNTLTKNFQLGGINNMVNTGSTVATLNLYVTAFFTTPPVGPNSTIQVSPLSASLSFGQPGQSGSLSFTQYVDPSGTAFGMVDPSSTKTISLTSSTLVNTVSGSTGIINFIPSPNYPAQPYSVTEEFTVALDPGSAATMTFLNNTIAGNNPTPEPASMGLMGLAGAGVLLLWRRRA